MQYKRTAFHSALHGTIDFTIEYGVYLQGMTSSNVGMEIRMHVTSTLHLLHSTTEARAANMFCSKCTPHTRAPGLAKKVHIIDRQVEFCRSLSSRTVVNAMYRGCRSRWSQNCEENILGHALNCPKWYSSGTQSGTKNHVSRPCTAKTARPETCWRLVTEAKTAIHCIYYGK